MKMSKTFLLVLLLVAVAGVLSGKVPEKPAHARALMHPELRAGQGNQVLQCYEGMGQTGDSVR